MGRLLARIFGTLLALSTLLFATSVDTGHGNDATMALLIGGAGVLMGLLLIIGSFHRAPTADEAEAREGLLTGHDR